MNRVKTMRKPFAVTRARPRVLTMGRPGGSGGDNGGERGVGCRQREVGRHWLTSEVD
jgi:hypothetical protein